MNPITNKETALLMLLSEQPMHAYQIEKIVEEREMRFWTEISMSSIYKLLNKLSMERLISKRRKNSENGIAKNVFSLTAAGRKTLEEKIRELISEPEHTRWRIDLATSHLGVLSQKEVLACLKGYREKLLESIDGYARLDDYLVQDNCEVYNRALAKRPKYLLEGEVRWLDEYIQELKKGGGLA
jgi:DNA-binding PadR family transcriptional regulator